MAMSEMKCIEHSRRALMRGRCSVGCGYAQRDLTSCDVEVLQIWVNEPRTTRPVSVRPQPQAISIELWRFTGTLMTTTSGLEGSDAVVERKRVGICRGQREYRKSKTRIS